MRPALAIGLALWPGLASAESLLCLGTGPRFLLTITGESAAFDYLGDGEFAFAPAPKRGAGSSEHRLSASRTEFRVFLEDRTCAALGMAFPVSLEIAEDDDRGVRPFAGCCIWKDDASQ